MGKKLTYRRRDPKPEHVIKSHWTGEYLVWDEGKSGLLLLAGAHNGNEAERAVRVAIYERQWLETHRLDYAACLAEVQRNDWL